MRIGGVLRHAGAADGERRIFAVLLACGDSGGGGFCTAGEVVAGDVDVVGVEG